MGTVSLAALDLFGGNSQNMDINDIKYMQIHNKDINCTFLKDWKGHGLQ
jgi:hypothetical protein